LEEYPGQQAGRACHEPGRGSMDQLP
jgi:hypothetical protein